MSGDAGRKGQHHFSSNLYDTSAISKHMRGKRKEREEEEEEAEGGKGRALRENNGDDNVFTAFIIIITYWALHEARL